MFLAVQLFRFSCTLDILSTVSVCPVCCAFGKGWVGSVRNTSKPSYGYIFWWQNSSYSTWTMFTSPFFTPPPPPEKKTKKKSKLCNSVIRQSYENKNLVTCKDDRKTWYLIIGISVICYKVVHLCPVPRDSSDVKMAPVSRESGVMEWSIAWTDQMRTTVVSWPS